MNDIHVASNAVQSDDTSSKRRKPYTAPICVELSAHATQSGKAFGSFGERTNYAGTIGTVS